MNLAVLRTYRAQLEQTLRVERVAVEQALKQALAERARLEAAAEQDAQRALAAARAGLPADEVAGRYVLMEGMTEAIAKARAAVAEAHRHWTEKMAEALEAARERKKLEALERRRAAGERRRAAAAAQRHLDEAAGRQFVSARDGQTAAQPRGSREGVL
ncbi:flagellar FliJ family protein [Nitrospira sp. Kam-Ns4a]